MKKISQVERMYNLLKDGQAYRTDQIQLLIYGGDHLGTAAIAQRISNIRKRYNIEIKCWSDKEIQSLSWYQIISKPEQATLLDVGPVIN